MQHLLFGVYLCAFLIGFISIFYLRLQYNTYRFQFLKTYSYHILALNIVVLFMALTQYYYTNILNTVQATGLIKLQLVTDLLFLIQKGVEYLGILVITYTLVSIHYQMLDQETRRMVKYIFIFILIVSTFTYGVGVAYYLNDKDNLLRFFCDIFACFSFMVVICIYGLTLFKRHWDNYNLNITIRSFLFFYLFVLSAFLILILFRIPYRNIYVSAVILLINLFSLLWSRNIIKREAQNKFSLNIKDSNIKHLVSEYNISNRELEILEYILKGYSNREIQKKLFISPHTVKNHNYNLYKKLGVSSRSELLRKVLENQLV